MDQTNNLEIVICETCNGTGTLITEDDHTDCEKCLGLGRLCKEIKFYPMDQNKIFNEYAIHNA